MMTNGDSMLKNAREVLESIWGDPEALTSEKLATALALDYLEAGDTDRAVQVIKDHLLTRP